MRLHPVEDKYYRKEEEEEDDTMTYASTNLGEAHRREKTREDKRSKKAEIKGGWWGVASIQNMVMREK